MLAHAFLSAVRADGHTRRPTPDNPIPLTCSEIQRLFVSIAVRPLHGLAHRLGWSGRRCRHQARWRTSRYRRQAALRT
jgi:hypothetical protein